MDGLRGKGYLDVWHHGRLEYHPTKPWGFVLHSVRRGSQVFGCLSKGRGKDAQTLADEESGRRGGKCCD